MSSFLRLRINCVKLLPALEKVGASLVVWFNSDIHHKLHILHSLRKKQKRPNSTISHERVASAELSMQAQMTEAKSTYESKLVNDFAFSNNCKIYLYLRSFSKNNEFPPTLSLESESAGTSPSKAALFNKIFHSAFSKKLAVPSVRSLNLPDKLLCSISFSDLDTYNALCSIDPSKASGVDGIPSKVWKHSALALYQPVHHLFCVCMKRSYLPQEWRTHQIVPISKRDSRETSVSNYRLISLLCCNSKVLEKLIFDKTIEFLTDNVISSSKFGFMKKRSTL